VTIPVPPNKAVNGTQIKPHTPFECGKASTHVDLRIFSLFNPRATFFLFGP